ncbi:MAG: Hsp20/alpha crystallin family protein, partial [Solirubrobacteraceae bacterium]
TSAGRCSAATEQPVVPVPAPAAGTARAGAEISVQGRTLHIRAERRQETKEEAKGRYRSEFRYGSFARRIPLPEGVSEEQVTASYKDGILEARVPLPAPKPAAAKKIQIQRST